MKKTVIALAAAIVLSSAGLASALTIDTNPGWDGSVNYGWYGSGQSLTVDAFENHFEYIGFYFDQESFGRTFGFSLSDAMNNGNVLFSTTITPVSGLNVVNIHQTFAPNSLLYALIDYNGYSGQAAHFSYNNTYSGGNSVFGPLNSMEDWPSLDHRFVAEFSGNGAPLPVAATSLLFGTGFLGLLKTRRKK